MRTLPFSLAMRAVLVAAACAGFPDLVLGQQPLAGKPVRGWFGSGSTATGEGQALSLLGSVVETFDLAQRTAAPEVQALLRYDRRTRSRSWFVSADTSSRRFPDVGLSSITHQAAAGFNTSLGRKTRLAFDQSVRTSPFYMVSVFAPQGADDVTAAMPVPESSGDYAVLRRQTNSMTSAAAVTRLFAPYTSATVSYAFDHSHTRDTDFSAQFVKVVFNHHLGRYTVARAGYGRRLVERDERSASGGPALTKTTSHDIDVGIDYNRPISLSQRSTLVITTGSAIVPVEGGASHYRLLGGASLLREMGRTWRASLSYGRNLEFVETFDEPLLSDTATLRVDGRVSRRLDLSFSADLAKGSVGFAPSETSANGYTTYGGFARARWAVNRLVSGYAEYVAYGHAFDTGVDVPTGFGRDVRRSELRAGLTLWAPLIW